MLSMLLSVFTFILSAQSDWAWSVHPESGFKVLTPFALVHKVVEMPTPGETIKYHQYYGGSLQDSSLHLAFVIDHYQVTSHDIGGDKEYLQEFFGVTVDQILQSIGGKLVYMDFTTSAEREICIWRATFQEGRGVIRGHLIIKGDKYFGLQAFGLAEESPDGLMLKFLDSFQITEQNN